MVTKLTANAVTGNDDVVIVGSYNVIGTAVMQAGQSLATLTAAGAVELDSKIQAIARGDYVVIYG